MDPPSGAVRTLVLICRVSDAVTAASAVVSGPCLSSWTLDVRGPEARVTLKKVVSASGLPVFSTRLIWAIDVGDAVPGGPDAVPLGDLSVTSVGQADHEWREVSETWSIPPPFFTPFRAGKVLTRGFSLRCFVVVRGARIVPLPTLRAPRLSLPSKALTNESARETFGAVGITNQGATCYSKQAPRPPGALRAPDAALPSPLGSELATPEPLSHAPLSRVRLQHARRS